MAERGGRSIWGLVDALPILFMLAYMAARVRTLGHPSPMVRVLAQRDHAYCDAVLLERELAIFRSHRQNRPAKRRSYYSPEERAEILQLTRLRGRPAKETAARFAVHPNAIRNWKKAQLDKRRCDDALGRCRGTGPMPGFDGPYRRCVPCFRNPASARTRLIGTSCASGFGSAGLRAGDY